MSTCVFGENMKLWSAILVCALAFSGLNAEAARRMGGGGSVGKQSNNVTQKSAPPAAPAQNATNSTAAKPAAAAPVAAPAVAPKKPWGAMLGGLAAGLGLAWLANSLGLGGMLGGIMQAVMFGLLAFGVIALVMYFVRSRGKKSAGNSFNTGSPYAMQGAGSASPTEAVTPRSYSPQNVGNDASARPWEGNTTAFDNSNAGQAGKSMIGSGLQASDSATGLSGSQSWGVPADFDTAGFFRKSQRQITCSTGNIQHLCALLHVRHHHRVGFPSAVQTHGHQVVHDVVLGGDRIKHATDVLGFVFFFDALESEMCLAHGYILIFRWSMTCAATTRFFNHGRIAADACSFQACFIVLPNFGLF